MDDFKKFYFIIPSLLIVIAIVGYFSNWITNFVAFSAIIIGVLMFLLAIVEKNKI